MRTETRKIIHTTVCACKIEIEIEIEINFGKLLLCSVTTHLSISLADQRRFPPELPLSSVKESTVALKRPVWPPIAVKQGRQRQRVHASTHAPRFHRSWHADARWYAVWPLFAFVCFCPILHLQAQSSTREVAIHCLYESVLLGRQ